MNTVLVKHYGEPQFNRKEILRYAKSEEVESIKALVDECISELQGKFTYKVCYIKAEKGDFFKEISPSVFNKYLSDCSGYIIFAATIGIEIDRLITKYSRISPSKAHMFQAIGAERIEALCDMFEQDMKKRFCIIKPRISPGYGDMPLEMQREVFDILDCPRKIGLTLTDSMLMSPTKSVTAFIGVVK